jgi:CubicO group peptidase (beta-lactamase class C family)
MRSLDRFGGSPLIFRPGERCEYSSYAYILLSAVVERAGKQAYDEQVRERIREPLGLDSLQLDHAGTGKNWSVGYDKKGARVGRQADEANDWKFGAGGYKSDVGDFAAWALSLLEHRLVPDRLERLMWTPQDTDNGQVTEFGLGFEVDGKGKDLRVAHNGLQGEATTRMVLYPEQGHGIVVMTNCGFGDPGAITTAIYRALR